MRKTVANSLWDKQVPSCGAEPVSHAALIKILGTVAQDLTIDRPVPQSPGRCHSNTQKLDNLLPGVDSNSRLIPSLHPPLHLYPQMAHPLLQMSQGFPGLPVPPDTQAKAVSATLRSRSPDGRSRLLG